MKNVLHQNQYLIVVCIFMFVVQLYNATIVKSQTVNWDEEYSHCSNWEYGAPPIAPPLPPEPIILVTLIINPALIGPAGQPGFPGQVPIPGSDLFVPYQIPYYTDYDCPNYDTLIVTPNRDWKQNGLYVILNPKETTEYTITYKVTKDPHCDNVYTKKVKIEVYQACSFSDDDIKAIQTDFPWIDALENVCINSIEVYEKSSTNYLMFNYPNSKTLYYQDGSILCTDKPDYSCLEAYQLTNKVKSWSCDQTPIENPIDETWSTFNNYTWLSNFVNHTACNGESVYVYDADTYEFLIVKTNQGESMYKTNGDLICFSPAGGFSFIGLYNESRILDSWHCEQGFQVRESKPILQSQGIQIFPNPAKDKVFINLQQLTFEQPAISIYDVQGKQVKQITSAAAFAGIVQMNVNDLVRGIYLVEVRTSEHILTQKLLIK